MIVVQAIQGSKEWHELRALHFNASEAPAMMGDSKYQSRGALLRKKATGETKDVSPAQQRIFDKGHAAEEGARPLTEVIIGEELYPTTATRMVEGLPLLASFDGITVLDDIVFEHKLLNAKLVERVKANDLEPHYYWQLEQQLLVSEAERVIFVCSDGTEDNFHYCEYVSLPGRRAALIAGWAQFAKDLSQYQVNDTHVAEPEAIRGLPTLSFSLNGLTLTSNLDVFKSAALELVEESKKPIETDQDFANAASQVKIFKETEDKIKAVIEQAHGEVKDIDAFTKDLLFIGEQIRQARLSTDKQVTARKNEIRQQIQDQANADIKTHTDALADEVKAALPLFPFLFSKP